MWSYNIFVGLIGSVLNSYILYIFISERHSMITSVNAMIWYGEISDKNIFIFYFRMETFYRLLYSMIGVHWRSFNMMSDTNLLHFLMDREMVRSVLSRLAPPLPARTAPS